MTIRIKKDRIEFTANGGSTFTLAESNTGFTFDGTIDAGNIFQDGFQGSVSGYLTGSSPFNNTIQKFSLATDTNATDVGDLTRQISNSSGQSSPISGYTSGGYEGVPGIPYTDNIIDKFPFATDTNATDVGDISVARYSVTGQSSSTNGYISGGALNPNPPLPSVSNVIDKFPFATDTNATDVGDLTQGRYNPSGQSSMTHGYTSGGATPAISPRSSNVIDKFPFSADSNATDVGDLAPSTGWENPAGQSSTESGYLAGGAIVPTVTNGNAIQKFPFATDSNATDTTDLTQARISASGVSSTVSGYASGGEVQPSPNVNTIDKFPFATNSNATDVGDLLAANRGGGSVGKQY